MIPDKATEYRLRLDDLSRHPWHARLIEAAKFYQPKTDLPELLPERGLVHLEEIGDRLSAADKARENEIAKLCRPHWEGEGIPPAEVPYRDLLDDAFDALAVLELAIEADYLDIDTLAPRIRPVIFSLCWSEGVRSFIRIYECDAVVHLATRCDIVFPEVPFTLPEINPDAEIAFPGLTAMFTQFKGDEAIRSWTRVLDDFVEFKGDIEGFWAYLAEGATRDMPAWVRQHYRQRLMGGVRFVEQLGGYFRTLEPEYRLSYARLFRYFAARHYGYRQEGRARFEKVDKTSWGERLARTVTVPQRLAATLAQDYPDEGLRMKIVDAKAKAFLELDAELHKIAMQLVARERPLPDPLSAMQ